MNKIKAIAFDLGGVLIKENDYSLTEKAQILEKSFGKINNNDEYLDWATKTTNFSKKEINQITEEIIQNIYDLRDPDIFNHLPKVKLAIASNHLSAIHKWIDKSEIRKYFDYILISADIGIGKPNKEFFEKLVSGLGEKKEDILFIDDDINNVEGAKKFGLSVLHYNRSKNLTNEVLNALE